MRIATSFTLIFLLFYVISANAKPLRVAVSSNFAASLHYLLATTEFKQFDVVVTESSSGTHYAQISRGAPVDVFLSADASYVDLLVDNKIVKEEQTGIYIKGRLAYIDRSQTHPTLNSVKTYALAANKKLAIASPDIAPYGKAAEQFLSTISLWQQLLPSIVYGRSVMQVYNYYQSKQVNRAIVAYSLVYDKPQHVWLIPEHYHQPITQKWAILSSSQHPLASEFITTLLSEIVQKQLRQRGYETFD